MALTPNNTDASRLFPYNPDAVSFRVLCPRSQYSASRLAQAIEDCNANIINLNVTSDVVEPKPGVEDFEEREDILSIDVRVDRDHIASIARSLARYNYTVISDAVGPDTLSDTERRRLAELIRYIDI